MSARLMQAVNQVRLTNVAIVRLKRNGKRFEIACYKNKVVNWRNKVETDLDEVLQIDTIFHNVSKGIMAKSEDLIKAFGTANHEEVCRIILEKGDLQISDKEREVHYENLFKDIATIVAEKCVNPKTKRPYPVSTIESAMKSIHYAIVPSKSAKQQALDVIKKLENHIPIERAKMSLSIVVNVGEREKFKSKLEELEVQIRKTEVDQTGKLVTFLVYAAPDKFRSLNKLASSLKMGSINVQEYSVQDQREADVEEAANYEDEVTKGVSNTKITDETERNTSRQLLSSLATDDMNPEAEVSYANLTTNKPQHNTTIASKNKTIEQRSGLKCTTCIIFFGQNRDFQRQHYKSDLHRINLKLKMKKLPILSQDDFDMMDPTEREAIIYDYS